MLVRPFLRCRIHFSAVTTPRNDSLGCRSLKNRSLRASNLISDREFHVFLGPSIGSSHIGLSDLVSNQRSYPQTERTISSHDHPMQLSDAKPPIPEVVQTLFDGLVARDRGSLARAITLVESTNPEKKAQAQLLLSLVLQRGKEQFDQHGSRGISFRIGISGPPGAGKSTFIEAFGKLLTQKGHRVAVLAIDPSSSTTGGSLLGDKTRMWELSRDANAYIRPSPNSGKMGGVARNTNDAIVLCECAGYDLIIVETVGVGQSEYCVVDMVDMFVLLIPPAGGDELQGIKRGIVELSDLILVNKADGDLAPAALRIQYEYTSALKFVRARSSVWKPKVQRVSSFKKEGLAEAWQTMMDYREAKLSSGELEDCRRQQHTTWMWNHISDNIMRLFRQHPRVRSFVHLYEEQVADGVLAPGVAADKLLEQFTDK